MALKPIQKGIVLYNMWYFIVVKILHIVFFLDTLNFTCYTYIANANYGLKIEVYFSKGGERCQ